MHTKEFSGYVAMPANLRSESVDALHRGQTTVLASLAVAEVDAVEKARAYVASAGSDDYLVAMLTAFETLGRVRAFSGLFEVASICARASEIAPTAKSH